MIPSRYNSSPACRQERPYLPNKSSSCRPQPHRRGHHTFSFSSLQNLREQWNEVKHATEKDGFVVLQGRDTSVESLRKISQCFGYIQNHPRSFKGIGNIVGEAKYKKEKQVVSKIEFFPHTDGAYLDGMAFFQKKMELVGPPDLLFLQCVRPSVKGGESILIDGKEVIMSVLKQDPRFIPYLFSRKALFLSRGDYLVMHAPVFSMLSSKRYGIRYSYDRDFYSIPEAHKFFENFNNQFIHNREIGFRYKLTKGEILVVDNKRMLHGRGSFEGKRKFRRVWIYNPESIVSLMNASDRNETYFQTNESDHKGLSKFASYSVIRHRRNAPLLPPINAGFELDPAIHERIQQILRANFQDLI